jgi:ribose 5-phosphate isomerase A
MGMHGAAYVTDGGNYIVDCRVTPVMRAGALNQAMRDIVGVVETGLFIGMAEAALVAGTSGVTSLTRR